MESHNCQNPTARKTFVNKFAYIGEFNPKCKRWRAVAVLVCGRIGFPVGRAMAGFGLFANAERGEDEAEQVI